MEKKKNFGRAYNGDPTHPCLVHSSCLHVQRSVPAAVLRLRCAEPNDKGQVLANHHLKLSLLSLLVPMCPAFSQDTVNFCSSCEGEEPGTVWLCLDCDSLPLTPASK